MMTSWYVRIDFILGRLLGIDTVVGRRAAPLTRVAASFAFTAARAPGGVRAVVRPFAELVRRAAVPDDLAIEGPCY